MAAMTVDTYPHSELRKYNTDRHRDGAARQLERAQAALRKLEAAPIDPDKWRTQPVLDRFAAAVRLRLDYPTETVEQLAARAGMSKGRYWSIFRRALLFADTLPDDGWVLFT